MSELVAAWVTDPEAVRYRDGALRLWLAAPVLLTAAGLVLLPVTLAVLVILGALA